MTTTPPPPPPHTQIGDLNARVSEQTTEIEELKAVIVRQKQDQKKLTTEMSGLEQLTQGIERCVCVLPRVFSRDRINVPLMSGQPFLHL